VLFIVRDPSFGQKPHPIYVAEKLNRQTIMMQKETERTNRFFADARLPRERAELSDYKNSGYDRGHMAPAGNMATPEAMAQSFLSRIWFRKRRKTIEKPGHR
jgi:endonuclease G